MHGCMHRNARAKTEPDAGGEEWVRIRFLYQSIGTLWAHKRHLRPVLEFIGAGVESRYMNHTI